MDKNGQQTGTVKGTRSDSKGNQPDPYVGIFDGLLPRIETRGQSKHPPKRVSKRQEHGSRQN
ncbi:hypothetical protein SODALDRAFT_332040 [Sodiomyces alkalinus F11]|uniref:Uncharacterized protein n=1 Tax=Sodiomyces alkalinus (strain CBS 110278 / VKM F-3762 / F11) TaxID=1314773 RepID=A0A3N2PZE9_SODAK|nr:hypothetical protein SODALDRAFT_332040 [Sodiomyces alkalinus F11]ROT39900.1 hypothetical protein SODALDRAFT_332040 [Sodiomyces alkalinus F11]